MGLTRQDLFHLTWNRGRPHARPAGTQVFPGHSASAGVGELLGSVVHRKTRGPLGGREGFQFSGHESGDPGNLA